MYIYDVHARTPAADTHRLHEMIGELHSIEADIRGKEPDERSAREAGEDQAIAREVRNVDQGETHDAVDKVCACQRDQLLAETLGKPFILL